MQISITNCNWNIIILNVNRTSIVVLPEYNSVKSTQILLSLNQLLISLDLEYIILIKFKNYIM